MHITAEFVASVASPNQFPTEGLPEIALAGRSNVGKSSMINKVVGQKALARTSNTPGRTQTLNYYRITPDEATGKPFFLVDMPGYGYAAVSKGHRVQWKDIVEQYLENRPTLCGIIQLIDLRHEPQKLDHMMAEWLLSNTLPYLVVGNKADKVAKTKVPGLITEIALSLHVDVMDVIGFSAETGFGREELWNWMVKMANDPNPGL